MSKIINRARERQRNAEMRRGHREYIESLLTKLSFAELTKQQKEMWHHHPTSPDHHKSSKQNSMNHIERIRAAVASHASEHHDFPGRWVADEVGDRILLSWEGENTDPRVAGMAENPPDGCEPVPADSPWRQWGGDEIIAAAGMPQPQYSGSGGYMLPFDGTEIITQFVGWDA